MAVIDSIPIGAPCWIDLFTSDPDRSHAFYGELFGWEAENAGEDYGGYITFSKDGHKVAGAMRNDGAQATPDAWSVYLAVTDAKVSVDDAMAHGGAVIVPAMDVMALGTMAVVTDGGAPIGMWQPGDHKGFELLGEVGAPAWFEVLSRDYDGAVGFYQDVFGCDLDVMSDTPEFRYTALLVDGEPRAGVMDATALLPEGVPAHWQVYFHVADADASLARVVELGGSILAPAEDSPNGRLASAADPTGAPFRLQST